MPRKASRERRPSDVDAAKIALDIAVARLGNEDEQSDDIICATVSNSVCGDHLQHGTEVSRFSMRHPHVSWRVLIKVDDGDTLRVVLSGLSADDMSRLRVRGDIQVRARDEDMAPRVPDSDGDAVDDLDTSNVSNASNTSIATIVVLSNSGTIASVKRSCVAELTITVTTFYYYPTTERTVDGEDSSAVVQKLRMDLRRLLQDLDSADVDLDVDGHLVRGHKALLIARSDVFRRTIEEAHYSNDPISPLTLVGVAHEPFLKLLDFMYVADPTVLEGYEAEVLVLAKRFEMQDLADVCSRRLRRDLRADNALKMMTFADEHGAEDLRVAAAEKVVEHLGEITSSQEWRQYKDGLPSVASSLLEIAGRMLNKKP